MSANNYHFSFTTKVSPAEAADKIWRISDWWTSKVTGTAEHKGDVFTVNFGETFVTLVVAEELPATGFVWAVTDCNLHWLKNKNEWNGTQIVWAISSAGGETTISMTHIGLVPEVECYENCRKGWNFYVGECLRRLMDEDKGLSDMEKARRQAAGSGTALGARNMQEEALSRSWENMLTRLKVFAESNLEDTSGTMHENVTSQPESQPPRDRRTQPRD
jgi:hypothetical protein